MRHTVCILALGSALCAGGCSSAPIGSAPPVPSDARPQTSKFAARSWIYVANAVYGDPSITTYGRRADGNAAPLHTIAGSNTLLREPFGITVDRRGKIYVANVLGGGSAGYGSILVFSPSANGNVAPVATITQGLNYP